MPISVPDAHDFLQARARALPTLPDVDVPDVPQREFTRSPGAHRVAELAGQSGLFLFHYEHRAHLSLPEEWVPAAQPELADPPAWKGGVLPERKYQSFRHDLPLGGYHPLHRAKWATHELCHGLVGFAWRPDASPFFLATAGRLAELLPVVLWYGLDEAFLRRCPDHQGGGALFRTLCADCEAVAAAWPEDPDATEHLQVARRYLDRELAAIARSRREGRPVAHHHATLDLCSDGLAYASAHGARLTSPVFREFMERFGVEGAAWHTSLDALEARVVEVAYGICGGAVRPHQTDPAHARMLWVLQDLGWRLCQVRSETEGEAADALESVIDGLASAVAAQPAEGAEALARAEQAYAELFESFHVPEPERMFALGYAYGPVDGSDRGQLVEGIASALPLTSAVFADDLGAAVNDWAAQDSWSRERLSERFSRALGGPLGDLARFEAAVGAVPGGDPVAIALGNDGERFRLATGARLLDFDVDVVALADAIELGTALWTEDLQPVSDTGEPWPRQPTTLLIGADLDGNTLIVDVRVETAERLRNAPESGIAADDGELQALVSFGALVPVRWPVTRPLPTEVQSS